ncbi:hypothetical protein BOX15_Mlig000846g3 [Macrostomum lignano]|uniref:Mab-21-like HhH/H2TH-like domain-containing protein n=2 Tax=Macrostomum lignano TaxID=282301 RepID=A0A267EU20_9PLAT|nr:hypothetical protein BOX15_Mlig000846g3 [Macrostomum lignano]
MNSESWDRQLLHAAVSGDVNETRRLLRIPDPPSVTATKSPNCRNERGETPLWLAANAGALDVARTLVEAGADVDCRNERGETPLWIAGQNGQLSVARLLLGLGTDVDCQRRSGESVLWIAACNDHLRLVELLLRNGARQDLLNQVGICPLWIAACNCNADIVDSLLQADNVDCRRSGGESALWIASQSDCPRVVQTLLIAGAEVDTTNSEGQSALWAASRLGHAKISAQLLAAGADVNLSSNFGETPLWVAAHNGHADAVKLLLNFGAAAGSRDRRLASSPVENAARNRHPEVLRLLLSNGICESDVLDLDDPLIDREFLATALETPENNRNYKQLLNLSSAEFSKQLCHSMRLAGFTASRAAKQSALARALEAVSRSYLQQTNLRIVGSFAEGWGACFERLDGTIGADSDIDVTCLSGSRYHIGGGVCDCQDVASTSRLVNGHVELAEYSESHPATAERGTQVRPDMDIAFANPCCRYPVPEFLASPGHLPERVLSSVTAEMSRSWSCHLIRASSPGKESKQLRVSTTFLENSAMRSLSTVQGQVFLLLKYLIKRVIGRHYRGLKSYHAKTLLFRTIQLIPEYQWVPDNLEQLVQQCLRSLIDHLSSSTGLLPHFFVPNALVYLRKNCDSSSAADAVSQTLKDLRHRLIEFQQQLVPISEAAPFHLHPFRLMPLYFLETPCLPGTLEFHHIYLAVKLAMLSLAQVDDSQCVRLLIDRLPDAACTARTALKVLVALKDRQKLEAKRLLREGFGNRPCRVARQIPCELDCDVLEYLGSRDSAWQFSMRFEQPISLAWLPSPQLRAQFPARMTYYDKRFFLNFSLLVNSLQLELDEARQDFLDDWFADLRSDPGCDFEELFTFSLYSREVAQLRLIRDRLLRLSSYQTSGKFLQLTRKILELSRR